MQVSERRRRLCRLLGPDAILALDMADDEFAELDRPDIGRRPRLDENLNRKVCLFIYLFIYHCLPSVL